MIQSFISQDTNIVCSNMTNFIPRKLGLDPQKELIEFAGISICGKKRMPLLNISDKKISGCFICKMPQKIWGGLSAFFASISMTACVSIIFMVAGISIPFIGPIIASYTLAGLIGIAIVTDLLADIYKLYTIYRVIHECDNVLMGQWINYHETALIEKMPALLNKSQLKCPVGGTLDIILDDKLAYIAAAKISFVNSIEVREQWGNKSISGFLTLVGNGGSIICLAISCYSEYSSTKDEPSNQKHDPLSNLAEAGKGYISSTIPGLFPFNLSSFITGLASALLIYGIDQGSKYLQEELEEQTQELQNDINQQDQREGNNIGIIASTQ